MTRFFILLPLCCALITACVVPADGPYGRVRGDIETGLGKAADDLANFSREVRASTKPPANPQQAGALPLRVLVIPAGNLHNMQQETVLLDLHRDLEARGFEIIHEDVPALHRYRAEGFDMVMPARLIDLANGLPTGSFGVLEVILRGWDVERRGSLRHNQISGRAKFSLLFRFAANWRHVHLDDNNYWERRKTIEREVTDRQITFLEDQVAQALEVPQGIQHDPELRAAYVGEVIAEAFGEVAASLPRAVR